MSDLLPPDLEKHVRDAANFIMTMTGPRTTEGLRDILCNLVELAYNAGYSDAYSEVQSIFWGDKE
jgi:hypothetical protein